MSRSSLTVPGRIVRAANGDDPRTVCGFGHRIQIVVAGGVERNLDRHQPGDPGEDGYPSKVGELMTIRSPGRVSARRTSRTTPVAPAPMMS